MSRLAGTTALLAAAAATLLAGCTQVRDYLGGEDNTERTESETFTLDAGMSARYSNLLSEVFGLEPDSLGALLITSSSPDLLVMSRTYTRNGDGSGGTYGQAMPAVSLDRC